MPLLSRLRQETGALMMHSMHGTKDGHSIMALTIQMQTMTDVDHMLLQIREQVTSELLMLMEQLQPMLLLWPQ